MNVTDNKTDKLIEELARSVAAGFLGVDKQISELRNDMNQEIGLLRNDMNQEIGLLRNDMNRENGSLRNDMNRENGSLRSEMRDGFSSLHAQLATVKEELTDIKQQLGAIKHFAQSNDDAILDLVFELQKRIKTLERKITSLSK